MKSSKTLKRWYLLGISGLDEINYTGQTKSIIRPELGVARGAVGRCGVSRAGAAGDLQNTLLAGMQRAGVRKSSEKACAANTARGAGGWGKR